MAKQNNIIWVVVAIIALIIFLNIQLEPEELTIKPHFYKDGVEVFPTKGLFSIITPPGGSYNQISFDIFVNNTGNVNLDMKIIEATPQPFKDALSNLTQLLLKNESKIVWSSGLINTEQFENYSQPVTFFVKISGENASYGIPIYKETSVILEITTPCVENWECSDWGSCGGVGFPSTETRICNDLNSCGTIIDRPPLSTYCCIPLTCENVGGYGWLSDGCGDEIYCEMPPVRLYEYQDYNDGGSFYITSNKMSGQTFTVGTVSSNVNVKITKVQLFAEVNAGGTTRLYVYLYKVSSNRPTGNILSSGSVTANELKAMGSGNAWRTIYMSSYIMEKNTKYVIIVKGNIFWDSTSVRWRYISPREYMGGYGIRSNDGGDTWIVYSISHQFRIWGIEWY